MESILLYELTLYTINWYECGANVINKLVTRYKNKCYKLVTSNIDQVFAGTILLTDFHLQMNKNVLQWHKEI